METNRDRLVEISVMGQVSTPSYPSVPATPYLITRDGKPELLPSFGSIVYNVKVGDAAFGWAGDRIQPGASISASGDANTALNIFACLGNTAIVTSGAATGSKGIVVGKSGRFADNVIVHFAQDILEALNLGDKVLIRSHGRGLRIAGHEEVVLKSLSPDLLDAMSVRENAGGVLEVPVVAALPSTFIGAGVGLTSEGGALNLQASEPALVEKYALHALRLGDFVAVEDLDSRYFHGYRGGAIGIGVICQTDSPVLGHGPGMTLIMTSSTQHLAPRIDPRANLVHMLPLDIPAAAKGVS